MCSLSPGTFVSPFRSSNETAVDFQPAFFHPIPPGIPLLLPVPVGENSSWRRGWTRLIVRLVEIDHFVAPLSGFFFETFTKLRRRKIDQSSRGLIFFAFFFLFPSRNTWKIFSYQSHFPDPYFPHLTEIFFSNFTRKGTKQFRSTQLELKEHTSYVLETRKESTSPMYNPGLIHPKSKEWVNKGRQAPNLSFFT